MLTDDQRRQGAADLFRAEHEKKVIPQLSRTYPEIELDDAYAIQRIWAELHMARGARQIGHKIGLTSRAMQMASKITEPDYGHLLDTMMFRDGSQIPATRFLKPRLEVELAFVMGATLAKNGIIEESGMSAAIMGRPAAGVAWLVNKPSAVGAKLRMGQIVLAGSFTRPVDIAAGDVIQADCGPLGAIGVSFT